jgi:hypothetical protein
LLPSSFKGRRDGPPGKEAKSLILVIRKLMNHWRSVVVPSFWNTIQVSKILTSSLYQGRNVPKKILTFHGPYNRRFAWWKSVA